MPTATELEPEQDEETADASSLGAYEINASPNDFNVATIYDFIKSGVVKIPSFQRNYVWTLGRASKLIESLLIGLPIPQIFLYEEARNSFLVIDGQQRLMSLYYFRAGRFPRENVAPQLRKIYDEHGGIPDEVFRDDRYFRPFRLKLPKRLDETENPFNGLGYEELRENRAMFDLRTIRNVIIRQLVPREDKSSVYEIFNRLNTGGVALEAQEIRASLFFSRFYDMLGRANEKPGWRRLYGQPEADVHMGDIQQLLRGFALLVDADKYRPSMVRFLDGFSERARTFGDEDVAYIETLFTAFLSTCDGLQEQLIRTPSGGFSVMLFEAVFHGACRAAYEQRIVPAGRITPASIEALRHDPQFVTASARSTTTAANVGERLAAGRRLVHLS